MSDATVSKEWYITLIIIWLTILFVPFYFGVMISIGYIFGVYSANKIEQVFS